MKMGGGTFITPEQVSARNPQDHQELFRDIPAVRFRPDGTGRLVPFIRSRAAVRAHNDVYGDIPPGFCRPRVYVDGTQVSTQPRNSVDVTIEEIVDIRDVVAVEAYSGAATFPLQWGGSQGSCGVIIFWTGGR
jgi:hypothetical protein